MSAWIPGLILVNQIFHLQIDLCIHLKRWIEASRTDPNFSFAAGFESLLVS